MSLFSKILKFSSADPNFKQRCPPVFGDLQIFQISFSTSSFVSSLASCVVKVLIRKLVLQVTFCPIMISVSWATRLKTCNLKIPLLFFNFRGTSAGIFGFLFESKVSPHSLQEEEEFHIGLSVLISAWDLNNLLWVKSFLPFKHLSQFLQKKILKQR